jgi:plastocyanin
MNNLKRISLIGGFAVFMLLALSACKQTPAPSQNKNANIPAPVNMVANDNSTVDEGAGSNQNANVNTNLNSNTNTNVNANVPDSDDDDDRVNENTNTASKVKVFNLSGINFKFSQEEIKVKKGDTVKIVLNVTEGFHDWVVDEFNAATQQVAAGATTEVQFVANKSGTFEYYCSVGKHRAMGMIGKLIVE